ncbi:MAG: hypothetical protein JWQ97_428 [Phenylobacterium sp.]|nr:hypothetical protein [Phenylobacterium sp.]
MSAMLKPFAPWSLPEAVVADLVRKGAHAFEDPVDPKACGELLREIRCVRRFDESLFLSEAEFDAGPQHTGVNPRPGRNLLERLEPKLGFVERSPQIVEALWSLLGPDYRILDKKVVCGVPARAIPAWLKRRIHGNPVNNLGAYVRPEHRDVTYFYGIDFHQDLIDHKDREADFITLYVYLHPVTGTDAPLHLLEGSHRMGGQVFPHDLKRTGPDSWRYRCGQLGDMFVTQKVLTGEAGFAALWHACTLHGTQPDAADHERISLRYLIARGGAKTAGIDTVNATLAGPLSLADTRQDLAADGSAALRGNTVLKA